MGTEIKLGDKVKCRITGYTGIATSRTEYINGCIQIEVTPKIKKGTNPKPEEMIGMGVDEGSLEKVDEGINKKKVVKKESNGGPSRVAKRMRGF